MKILSIDPSINNLGWAYQKTEETGTVLQRVFGTIRAPRNVKEASTEDRLGAMIEVLEIELFPYLDPSTADVVLLLEQPETWGAYKSMASQHSGSLGLLDLLVGALFWWGWDKNWDVHLVKVSKWKGQLPKEVTQRRAEEYFQVHCDTDHEADALGILQWWLEKGQTENLEKLTERLEK